MRILFMLSLILVTLFLSFAHKAESTQTQTETNNSQNATYSEPVRNDKSHVFTGFYFLTDEGHGIKMQKDHSDKVYNISKKPFVSIKNILRAAAQKNVVQGRDIYGVVIVLDNAGTRDLEQGTGNPSHPQIAVVIANRLLYIVDNTSKINTGIMQIILSDYSEEEVNAMIDAINRKR